MGYQESLVYVQPQRKFRKLIQAYRKAERAGYYEVAGAVPRSVIVLKEPLGNIPAGAKLLWVCGDREFHTLGGIFGGYLTFPGKLTIQPVEALLDGPNDPRVAGIEFDQPYATENSHMKRYTPANYAFRLQAGLVR